MHYNLINHITREYLVRVFDITITRQGIENAFFNCKVLPRDSTCALEAEPG